MGHDHSHGHSHGHAHGNQRAVGIAAGLTGVFMVAEVVGGVVSGSLALLADAGHMLTDFGSLLLAWLGFRLAQRPADWRRTYGFDRFSVLAAFVNGISLFAICGWILIEAIRRFFDPAPIEGGVMLGIAAAGLLVNIVAFWVLTRSDSSNLNVRAAALHVMGDLLGSVAAIIGATVILYTGWTPIDPILSVIVCFLILRSAYAVVRESGHILLEGSPSHFDGREVCQRLPSEVAGVERVRHVHAWCITQERPMATLEVFVHRNTPRGQARDAVKAWLREHYGIAHSTVELFGGAADDDGQPQAVC